MGQQPTIIHLYWFTSPNTTVDLLFHSREAGFLKEFTANPKMEVPLMFQIPALFYWGFVEAFLLQEYLWLLVLGSKMLFFHLFMLLKILIKIGVSHRTQATVSHEVLFLWLSILWSGKPNLGDKHVWTVPAIGTGAGLQAEWKTAAWNSHKESKRAVTGSKMIHC